MEDVTYSDQSFMSGNAAAAAAANMNQKEQNKRVGIKTKILDVSQVPLCVDSYACTFGHLQAVLFLAILFF